MIDNQPALHFDRAWSGRRYDYWLGNKDNFQPDRDSADAIIRVFPHASAAAREHRALMQRMVTCLAAEHQAAQFLDIGCGLPHPPNVHDIAQSVIPAARVLYVDNDPMAITHARVLLVSDPAERVGACHGDLTRPGDILDTALRAAVLDRDRPIAVLLLGVLHLLPDQQAATSLHALAGLLPAGSLIGVSHPSVDMLPDHQQAALTAELADPVHGSIWPRTRTHITSLLDELDATTVGPGLVPSVRWRPDLAPAPATDDPAVAGCYAWLGMRR